MEGFIIIDLTKYNYKSLERLVVEAGIEDVFTSEMLAHKKSEGVARIYIHEATLVFVGFTTKKERWRFQFTEYGTNLFLFSDSFTLSKFQTEETKEEPQKEEIKKEEVNNEVKVEKKSTSNEVLTLDSILDKISKFGKKSLTEQEIKFLENFSKS